MENNNVESGKIKNILVSLFIIIIFCGACFGFGWFSGSKYQIGKLSEELGTAISSATDSTTNIGDSIDALRERSELAISELNGSQQKLKELGALTDDTIATYTAIERDIENCNKRIGDSIEISERILQLAQDKIELYEQYFNESKRIIKE